MGKSFLLGIFKSCLKALQNTLLTFTRENRPNQNSQHVTVVESSLTACISIAAIN